MRSPLPILLSLSLLGGCASSEKRDEPIVKKLKIEGAAQVKPSQIEKRILTTQQSWIPFSHKQYFDPDVWRTDLRRIERFYRERGFYQAHVVEDEVTPVAGKEGKEVAVRVKIDEGKPTVIEKISITGLDDLPPEFRDQAMADLPLKEGQVFLEEHWEGIKQRLVNTLRELGYAQTTVEGEAQVDVATQKAQLTIHVAHGQRYKFGEVHVTTGEGGRVEPWRIAEQAKASIVPGEWYSETAQAEAQSRVFKMGVFGAAKVRPETPDPASDEVPINVDVRESAFHSLRWGPGVGVDQTRNEAHVLVEYTDRNFMGGLRRLTLTAQAGYAFIPNFYTGEANGGRSGPIAKLSAELVQPRLGFRDLRLETKVELERGLEPAYAFIGGRGKVGLVWQPTPSLAIFPSYNLEVYRLQSGNALVGGTAPPLLFGCPATCVLSYLEEKIEWDKRDDRQEPKSGYYLGLTLQEGGGFLGGSFGYWRLMPEGRYFYSFLEHDKLTLGAKLKFGTLVPSSGDPLSSPIVARFFSGGGNQMRGFNSRRLSPMYEVPILRPIGDCTPLPDGTLPSSCINAVTLPIGGNGLLESSFEVRYDLVGDLVLATFLDTGLVTSESFQFNPDYIASNMYYAVGAGVRYRTPIGPLRLDLAYRPNIGPPLTVYPFPGTALNYSTQTGCFGIGGKSGPIAGYPDGPCTLHLSIGEAF